MLSRNVKAFALAALFFNAQAASLFAQSADAAQSDPPLSSEQLEQLVAPVALYPDALLSQIFMASTYPFEVVQADRFVKANPKLTGDALTTDLESKPWDPSVKSLVNFPTVLAMMSEQLDSTIDLGDAFIADQKSVMDAVQRLRAKAQDAGNLKTTSEQTIIVEPAPQTNVQIIRIEPANPQVIYVPTYSPVVIYGPWPYPAYPPYYYYPPGYVARGALIGFGVGFACGAAWGYAWGNCNWGRSNVNVNINRNVNINTKINPGAQSTKNNINVSKNGNWQHNPTHRKGVAYRDNSTAQRFGGDASNRAIQSREPYRGRTDSGQQNPNRGATNQSRGQNAPARPNRAPIPRRTESAKNRSRASGQTANPGQNRPSTGQTGSAAQNRPANNFGNSASQNRSTPAGLTGVGGEGNATRNASQRGNVSRHPTAAPTGAARPSSTGAPARPAGGAGGARR